MICPKCGKNNNDGISFCVECGTSLKNSTISNSNLNSNDVPMQTYKEDVSQSIIFNDNPDDKTSISNLDTNSSSNDSNSYNGVSKVVDNNQSITNQVTSDNLNKQSSLKEETISSNVNSIKTDISSKNKKSNKGLIIVIIVLVVIVLVTLLLLLGKGKKNNDPSNSSNNNISRDINTTTTTTTNNNNNNNNSNNNSTNNSSNSKYNDDNFVVNDGDVKLAILGHVGHGRAALASAISKYFGNYVDEDTIDKGLEYNFNGLIVSYYNFDFNTARRNNSLYFFPGYADAIKSIITRIIDLDGVILIVSAPDGPQAQTKAYLELLKDLSFPRVVVFMNNCDQIEDEEALDSSENEIRDLLKQYGFNGDKTPIIKGSTTKALAGDEEAAQQIKDLMSEADNWLGPLNKDSEVSSHKKIKAKVYALTKVEGGRKGIIANESKLEVKVGDSTSNGKIVLPDYVSDFMPGDDLIVTVNLDSTVNMKKGQKIEFIEDGKVIISGVITEFLD